MTDSVELMNGFKAFNLLINNCDIIFQGKWLPLHTLAASGEFYLMDALLKHNVDINAVDKVDGMMGY